MRYFFMLFMALFISSAVSAQVHVNLNFNIDSQPIWGPIGYDHVENYYLPDYDVFYNVPQHIFYYNEKGRWISRGSLPSRFRNVNLYSAYKVVVNDRNPWRNAASYRDKYSKFRGHHDQEVIRDSRDSKYFVNKNHPEHNKWVKEQRHDNGRGQRNDNVRGQNNDRGNKDKRPDNRRDNNDNSRH